MFRTVSMIPSSAGIKMSNDNKVVMLLQKLQFRAGSPHYHSNIWLASTKVPSPYSTLVRTIGWPVVSSLGEAKQACCECGEAQLYVRE